MATDQEIRDRGIKFLPQQKYLQSPYQFNEPVVEEEETESFGIPNTNAFTNSGGGGGGGNNFNLSFSNSPYIAQPLDSFVTNRTNYGNTGYLAGAEPQPGRFAPVMDLIGKGIGMAIPGGNFLMNMAKNQSRENRLSATDNAFIDMQLANQEQSLHGGGNIGNQDRYGYNKTSGFGNYAETVAERANIAREFAEKYKDEYASGAKKQRPIDLYYLQKEMELKDTEKKVNFNDFVRQRDLAIKIRNRIKNDPNYDKGFNIHTDAGDKTPPGSYTPDGTPGGGAGRGIDIRGAGMIRSRDNNFQGDSGPTTQQESDYGQGSDAGFSNTPSRSSSRSSKSNNSGHTNPGKGSYGPHFADGGRVGYFFGGRVNYKAGGRVSFKNGGLASIL